MATDSRNADPRRVLLPESAFPDASGSGARVGLLPFQALLNLRGPAGDAGFVAAAAGILGVDLPLTPNRRLVAGDRAVIWLGPDEWLIVGTDGEAPMLEKALREEVGGEPWLSVVDVSSNYTGFALSGPNARNVLAKGCALDLDPQVFGDGCAAETILAQARVLLACLDATETFEIRVRNSFARYLLAWLADAMAEYRE